MTNIFVLRWINSREREDDSRRIEPENRKSKKFVCVNSKNEIHAKAIVYLMNLEMLILI